VRKPKELAVLMEVAPGANRRRRGRDVPRSRVLKDDAVGDIATHAPTSLEQLANLRSLPKGFRPLEMGAATSWPPCSAGSRAIRPSLPKLEKPRHNSNGAAIVEAPEGACCA
jgi:ribonuclease D